MQPGDVNATFADIALIKEYCGFVPEIAVKDGLRHFCDWYLGYSKK